MFFSSKMYKETIKGLQEQRRMLVETSQQGASDPCIQSPSFVSNLNYFHSLF